jgi:hypothetical protein
MGHLLQPAFLGGLFIGVLSSLPIVKFGNVCCCLWVVAGGVLAAYLAQSNHPFPIKAAEGALVGIIAGLVGACVAFPIELLFAQWEQDFVLNLIDRMNLDIPPDLRPVLEHRGTGIVARLIGLFVSLCINAVFGLLGGLLGVAMFKKDAPPPPPPGTVEILPPAQV